MRKLKKIGMDAKKAFLQLNNLGPKTINKALITYNQLLLKNKKQILIENSKDVKFSTRKHLIDRLILNEKRIDGIRNSNTCLVDLCGFSSRFHYFRSNFFGIITSRF